MPSGYTAWLRLLWPPGHWRAIAWAQIRYDCDDAVIEWILANADDGNPQKFHGELYEIVVLPEEVGKPQPKGEAKW